MANARLPWFRMYPLDYLASATVQAMDPAQELAHLRFLLFSAQLGGRLLADVRKLSRMARTTPEQLTVWLESGPLGDAWQREGDSLVNRRMVEVTGEQESQQAQASEAGKKSAETRRAKHGTAQPTGAREQELGVKQPSIGAEEPAAAPEQAPKAVPAPVERPSNGVRTLPEGRSNAPELTEQNRTEQNSSSRARARPRPPGDTPAVAAAAAEPNQEPGTEPGPAVPAADSQDLELATMVRLLRKGDPQRGWLPLSGRGVERVAQALLGRSGALGPVLGAMGPGERIGAAWAHAKQPGRTNPAGFLVSLANDGALVAELEAALAPQAAPAAAGNGSPEPAAEPESAEQRAWSRDREQAVLAMIVARRQLQGIPDGPDAWIDRSRAEAPLRLFDSKKALLVLRTQHPPTLAGVVQAFRDQVRAAKGPLRVILEQGLRAWKEAEENGSLERLQSWAAARAEAQAQVVVPA